MAKSYLIDGYNLIHALGMIQKNMAAGGLEASRRQLLEFLSASFGEQSPHVTVVFDAKQVPRRGSRQSAYRGLQIQFAPKGQSADDLIETLIASHSTPAGLVVVSNDHRLMDAARRRGAQPWTEQQLLDFVEANKQPATAPQATDNEPAKEMSPEEKKRWLKEFGTVEDDPELKEFFEHDRFE